MKFADNLRELMDQEGLTLAQVASIVGVSQPAVTGWLSGSKPRSNKLKKLAAYFSVSVENLINEDLEIKVEMAAYVPPKLDQQSRGMIMKEIHGLQRLALDMEKKSIELRERANQLQMLLDSRPPKE